MRLLLILLFPLAVAAQELNVGLQLNPLLPIPIAYQRPTPEIGISPGGLSYTVGAQIRMEFDKWFMAAGISRVKTVIGYGYREKQGLPGWSHSYVRVSRNSGEIPVVGGAQVYKHDRKLKYSGFAVGGMSYGWGADVDYVSVTGEGSLGTAGGGSTGGNIPYIFPQDITPAGITGTTYILAGGNIRTVLKKAGLITYGAQLHYPVKGPPNYQLDLDIDGTDYLISEPKLPYVNFTFCYYFLSVDTHLRRIRYRK